MENLILNTSRLNLGCGKQKFDSPTLNIDNKWCYDPDLLCDLNVDILPISDNQIDIVFAMYLFEYLSLDGLFHCMKEIYRVCKHGALVYVALAACDDHSKSATEILCDPEIQRTNLTLRSFKSFSKKLNFLGVTSGNHGIFHDVDFEMHEALLVLGYASSFSLRVIKND